jgi:hypothetical protein
MASEKEFVFGCFNEGMEPDEIFQKGQDKFSSSSLLYWLSNYPSKSVKDRLGDTPQNMFNAYLAQCALALIDCLFLVALRKTPPLAQVVIGVVFLYFFLIRYIPLINRRAIIVGTVLTSVGLIYSLKNLIDAGSLLSFFSSSPYALKMIILALIGSELLSNFIKIWIIVKSIQLLKSWPRYQPATL